MTGTRVRLTGTIRVDRSPGEAFPLFTARGERSWAPGWDPVFPAPAEDDSEPGVVFTTAGHGQDTTWVVTARRPGRLISYSRVIPHHNAGTVTVELTPMAGGSEVTVTYDLTSLGDEDGLGAFADGYPEYLGSWQADIATALER